MYADYTCSPEQGSPNFQTGQRLGDVSSSEHTCPSGCRLLDACEGLCRDASGPHRGYRCARRSFWCASACACCDAPASVSGICRPTWTCASACELIPRPDVWRACFEAFQADMCIPLGSGSASIKIYARHMTWSSLCLVSVPPHVWRSGDTPATASAGATPLLAYSVLAQPLKLLLGHRLLAEGWPKGG